ncbi:hypothetical protein MMC21_005926 [Puttea exsequens]|nr:hypothetical protein [Puttea exsequens]
MHYGSPIEAPLNQDGPASGVESIMIPPLNGAVGPMPRTYPSFNAGDDGSHRQVDVAGAKCAKYISRSSSFEHTSAPTSAPPLGPGPEPRRWPCVNAPLGGQHQEVDVNGAKCAKCVSREITLHLSFEQQETKLYLAGYNDVRDKGNDGAHAQSVYLLLPDRE